ncbi:MAG TPA: XamI family restriction endonuclease [Anaerolineae bacterium]|nr:XamI family restriction endonuclease [Anaerolineae bacterium]HRV94481.1 XamI family restriction endonuclease [Anaerolineae bacterium]
MAVNLDKPQLWKSDIAVSVDFYNNWFIQFAPKAYRETRIATTEQVRQTLDKTRNLTDIDPQVLEKNPSAISILRMATAPPIARDRLIGLAGISSNLVYNMETKNRLPVRMEQSQVRTELERIGQVIMQLIDEDIFPWIKSNQAPSETELYRAATVVADRLCGTVADPIIRNAQEQRQLTAIRGWLEQRGYTFSEGQNRRKFDTLEAGTFSFRSNVPISQTYRSGTNQVNIPIDIVIKPFHFEPNDFPLLIEAKSAGDFTNTNKRRKEEAIKVTQLRNTYGEHIRFILLLCGYFDSGYLGYEAAEGIDWVWEHRLDDLAGFGL